MVNKFTSFILSFLDTDSIEKECVKRYAEDIGAETFDKIDQDRIFEGFSSVEGGYEFLKFLLKLDKNRHFSAPVEAQQSIKGAYMRTFWMLKNMRSKEKGKKIDGNKSVPKLDSPFHA